MVSWLIYISTTDDFSFTFKIPKSASGQGLFPDPLAETQNTDEDSLSWCEAVRKRRLHLDRLKVEGIFMERDEINVLLALEMVLLTLSFSGFTRTDSF